MKLRSLHESLLPFIVIVCGLYLAVQSGLWIASGRLGTVGMVLGSGLAITVLLVLRERVWILIPFLWGLSARIPILPLPFTVRQLAVLYVLAGCLVLKAFKLWRKKPTNGILDFWLWTMVAYMVTVFIRNPVGVDALGSDRVGGMPYFDMGIACAAYWVLSRASARPLDAFVVPLLSVTANGIELFLNFVAEHIPSMAPLLRQLYSGVTAGNMESQEAGMDVEGQRETSLAGIGSGTALLACSYWRPFTLINPLYFGRFLVFLFALRAVMLSGFRSILMMVIVSFCISSYFRRGMMEVVRICLIGLFALTVLLIMQGNIINLPFAAQRALSFLPGKWDYAAKQEAAASTQWRVEMWQAMLVGNRYIENKWFGDGFGFTKRQLQIMAANATTGSTADQQENLMVSGGVHSGPISAIRYAGYVGLALFMVMIITIAWKAWHLIKRAKDTPYFAIALFFGIPAIWSPFNFVLIFGGFEGDLPSAIFTIGVLKMIENSLNDYSETVKSISPVKEVSPVRAAPLKFPTRLQPQ